MIPTIQLHNIKIYIGYKNIHQIVRENWEIILNLHSQHRCDLRPRIYSTVISLYAVNIQKSWSHYKFEAVNDENPTTTIVRRGQPFNGVVRYQLQ
ncbi:unnamed protein product [Leptidea sinapis]|uniref:Uncharacterized protein n=1 Tax=Leptidea sinapis TaxID=189913 RepID=A0A5E4Q7B4_9NEOP|nr:unnamed protein product [Leptidea sinapis]